MAILDCVMMCSISLEQEACSIVPSSPEAVNVAMYPEVVGGAILYSDMM